MSCLTIKMKRIRLITLTTSIVTLLGISIGHINSNKLLLKANSSSFYSDINEIIQLDNFDPRNELTIVQDQGNSNLCWAYSTINASEASILKNRLTNKDTLKLNPKALAYRRFYRNTDPLGNNQSYSKTTDWLNAQGSISNTPPILSMWQGPIGGDKPAADVYTNSLFRLEEASLISSGLDNENRINEIKQAIAKYGAVTASTSYDGRNRYYYNDKDIKNGVAHAITLIGWDDNIDKNLFAPKSATRNGGWLVKNSYLDNPYFYLTYDSKILETTSWVFNYAPKDKYDYNYYYDNNEDNAGLFRIKGFANIYQAKKGNDEYKEYLKAVNVAFIGNDVDVTIKVYTDVPSMGAVAVEKGTLKETKTEHYKYQGYKTIELDNPILLNPGSYFSIVVEVANQSNDARISLTTVDQKKASFKKVGSDYEELFNGSYVARIKAYTKCIKEEINEHIHDWNEPIYQWNEDYSSLKATRTCKEDSSHIESETVNTVISITTQPTCLTKGNKHIESKPFTNPAFEVQTLDINLGYGTHSYSSWIDEIAPSTEKEGIKGHKDCLICHRHFDNGDNEILDLSIPKLEKKVNVVISNGSGSEENVAVGSSITIKADKPKEGMKFVGWADKDGNIISSDETYTFIVTTDTYLVAIYEEIEIESSSSTSSSKPPISSSSESNELVTSNSSQLSSSSKENNSSNDQDKIDTSNNKKDVIIVTSIIAGTVSISLIGTYIYLFLKKKK